MSALPRHENARVFLEPNVVCVAAGLNRTMAAAASDAAARAKSLSGLLAGAKQAKKHSNKVQQPSVQGTAAAASASASAQETHAGGADEEAAAEQPRRQHTVAPPPDAVDRETHAAGAAAEQQEAATRTGSTGHVGGAAGAASPREGEEAPSGAGRAADSFDAAELAHHANSDASAVRGPSAGAAAHESPRAASGGGEGARARTRGSPDQGARGVPDFVDEARGGLHRPKTKKSRTDPQETHTAPVRLVCTPLHARVRHVKKKRRSACHALRPRRRLFFAQHVPEWFGPLSSHYAFFLSVHFNTA